MSPPINRPWEAFITSLAEMVVRGAKPISTLIITDSFENIKAFMEALVAGQPSFTKPLYYAINRLPHNYESSENYMIVMYTNTTAYEVYNRVGKIQDRMLKDALYGFLYGYDADSIWAYLDGANKASK